MTTGATIVEAPARAPRLLTPEELARAEVLLRRANMTPLGLAALLGVPVEVVDRSFRGERLPRLAPTSSLPVPRAAEDLVDEAGDVEAYVTMAPSFTQAEMEEAFARNLPAGYRLW